MTIREYDSKDLKEMISMIDEIYHEYGDRVFLEGFDSDLLHVDREYFSTGGKFWVALDEIGRLIGSVAMKNHGEGYKSMELKRMYVKKEYRGSVLSGWLLKMALDFAMEKECEKLFLWSDVRFKRAHAFYKKNGFSRVAVRDMDTGAMPFSEYRYEMEIVKQDKK